jgi:gamma-glutamyltranspeptidase
VTSDRRTFIQQAGVGLATAGLAAAATARTRPVENRLSEKVVRDLARLGGKASPLPPYDFRMGSYQQTWRDPKTGLLCAATDPRRAGKAGGI